MVNNDEEADWGNDEVAGARWTSDGWQRVPLSAVDIVDWLRCKQLALEAMQNAMLDSSSAASGTSSELDEDVTIDPAMWD